MRALFLIVAIIVFSSAGLASAQDDLRFDKIRAALDGLTDTQKADTLNNFASESVVCIAYYTIVRIAFLRHRDGLSPEANLELKMADEVLLSETRALMDFDVFEARLLFAQKDLIEGKLQNNMARISVLASDEFGERCKTHVETPAARIDYWIHELGYRD